LAAQRLLVLFFCCEEAHIFSSLSQRNGFGPEAMLGGLHGACVVSALPVRVLISARTCVQAYLNADERPEQLKQVFVQAESATSQPRQVIVAAAMGLFLLILVAMDLLETIIW
jgi:hypothetical protein